jgi:hypothetical protein
MRNLQLGYNTTVLFDSGEPGPESGSTDLHRWLGPDRPDRHLDFQLDPDPDQLKNQRGSETLVSPHRQVFMYT